MSRVSASNAFSRRASISRGRAVEKAAHPGCCPACLGHVSRSGHSFSRGDNPDSLTLIPGVPRQYSSGVPWTAHPIFFALWARKQKSRKFIFIVL